MTQTKLAVSKVQKGILKDSYFVEEEDVVTSMDTLPKGVYTIRDIGGMFMTKINYAPVVYPDKHVQFKDGTVGQVLSKVNKFFQDEVRKKYAYMGIAHKTGFLLYGPPGTGKSVTAHIIMEEMTNKYDAVCLVVPANTEAKTWKSAVSTAQLLNRPIVLFVDECEQMFHQQETDWLTFLDGHASISNFVIIGCTNYIDSITARMKRPSRIQHLIYVDKIEEEVARQYIQTKLPDLSKNVMEGIILEVLEQKASIDAYKNALVDFYVHTDCTKVPLFKKILKTYLGNERLELEEDEGF